MKKKNQLSSFDIIVLTRELREMLFGGFINKIYQPAKKEILIKITKPISGNNSSSENPGEAENSKRSSYQQINLKINLGRYLYAVPKEKASSLMEVSVQSPRRSPGAFAMLLRKHLKNGKIINIFQREFDRIIVLEVQKKETFQLIIELFGDGNIILVKAGKIVQPLFTQSWSYRTIRAGEEFKYPPARVNPTTLAEGEFCNLLSASKKDLIRTLIMDLQIPGIYAEELCHRLDLDKNLKASSLPQDIYNKLFEDLTSIITTVRTNPQALMIFNDETMTEQIDFVPLPLELYDELYTKEYEDFNTIINNFFERVIPSGTSCGDIGTQTSAGDVKGDSKSALERARLIRQREQQTSAITRFSAEITSNRKLGEAIYANYLRCEELLKEINRLRTEVAPDEIFEQLSNTDDIKELNPHEGYVILVVKNPADPEALEIKLDTRKNVMENANNYYDQGKHAQEKLRGARNALSSTTEQLAQLARQMKTQKKYKPKQKIVKHFWFEKFHWFITSSGNIVVGGRDARSNDQVVKRHLKDKDRYAHADISGAASVVIKHEPEDDAVPESSLDEACRFAVIYSKAWNAKVGSGTAYWVKPDQVSKRPQSGEFLSRGAFVIRGKRNHVGNIELLMAVGAIDYRGHFKLMAGPVEAVSAQARSYVVLAPGNIKKNAMANELSKLFNVAVDEILSLLPSGEFTIVDKVGFKE